MTYISTVPPQPATALRVVQPSLSDARLDVRAADGTAWCYLRPRFRPSFTLALLDDLVRVQACLNGLAMARDRDGQPAVGWVVLASDTPGVFSLGGDLQLFTELIRQRDAKGLRRYAHACVQVGFDNWSGYGGQAVSIGLAQGDALGGGFEALLSCNVLVAERRARFGLPEILFGLFPGMGAHAFLSRRVGAARAHAMITSGAQHTAEALHEQGIVDVLAEDGQGEQAVRDYVARNSRCRAAHAASHRAGRIVSPVTLDDMRAVADVWVETAMDLTDADLRRMVRISAAQEKARQRAPLAGRDREAR